MNTEKLITIIDRYLLNFPTFPKEDLNIDVTVSRLKTNKQWAEDSRSNQAYVFLYKIFKTEEGVFKAMVRFDKNTQSIDFPVPFIMTEIAENEKGLHYDKKVLHGRKIKKAENFIKEGVPEKIILDIFNDLTYSVLTNEFLIN